MRVLLFSSKSRSTRTTLRKSELKAWHLQVLWKVLRASQISVPCLCAMTSGLLTGIPSVFECLLDEFLRDSRLRAMVISTRRKSATQCFHEAEFSLGELHEQQSSNIHVNYADVKNKARRQANDDWATLQEVLQVSAGTPVRLVSATIGVSNIIKERRGTLSGRLYSAPLCLKTIEIV